MSPVLDLGCLAHEGAPAHLASPGCECVLFPTSIPAAWGCITSNPGPRPAADGPILLLLPIQSCQTCGDHGGPPLMSQTKCGPVAMGVRNKKRQPPHATRAAATASTLRDPDPSPKRRRTARCQYKQQIVPWRRDVPVGRRLHLHVSWISTDNRAFYEPLRHVEPMRHCAGA